MPMRKIVVTGAAGFIGSNLSTKLIEEGYSVVGIDNLSHGNLDNLRSIFSHQNFSFLKEDIANTALLSSVFEDADAVYHLAAGKIPRYSDALDTLLTNGIGSDSVFRAAFPRVKKIIAASTSDVYGKNPNLPFSENSDLVVGNPDVRRWSYAISKMFEEQLLYAYSERYSVPAIAIRFFGAYGINQSRDWLGGPIPVFIEKAKQQIPIEIHGDGSQTRSFTYIDDHVDALIRILDVNWEGPTHLNLGSDNEISIIDLAKKIWLLVNPNSEPKLELIPYSTFGKYEDVMRRIPDCSKARSFLHLKKSTDFDTGLVKTIQWQTSEDSHP